MKSQTLALGFFLSLTTSALAAPPTVELGEAGVTQLLSWSDPAARNVKRACRMNPNDNDVNVLVAGEPDAVLVVKEPRKLAVYLGLAGSGAVFLEGPLDDAGKVAAAGKSRCWAFATGPDLWTDAVVTPAGRYALYAGYLGGDDRDDRGDDRGRVVSVVTKS